MNNNLEIILDTETTGFDPKTGDKLVEIGCVEVKNRVATGNVYHCYINPEREVPEGAFKVHGLSTEFLKDKPKFAEIANDFLAFIEGKKLVIHNADFDMKFINYELEKVGKKAIPNSQVFCTLKFARQKFMGQPNSLDALCKRLGVDNSHRDKHGALLDAEILAEVYLELMGGKQTTFDLDANATAEAEISKNNSQKSTQSGANKVETIFETKVKKGDKIFEARIFEILTDEAEAHAEYISKMKNPIWQREDKFA
jgi:DNA polymerase III subunit epsilon